MDINRFKNKLGEKWRRPKGIHSKLRLKKAGHRKLVSAGYRGPRETRGLSKGGLRMVRVSTVGELATLNKDSDGIIVSGTVGTRKRVDIVKAAAEKGFQIFNVKDVQVFIDSVKKKLEERKKAKVGKKEAKKKEKKRIIPRKKEKAEEEEKKVEEEKKEADKKEEERREAEKVMIKKG